MSGTFHRLLIATDTRPKELTAQVPLQDHLVILRAGATTAVRVSGFLKILFINKSHTEVAVGRDYTWGCSCALTECVHNISVL